MIIRLLFSAVHKNDILKLLNKMLLVKKNDISLDKKGGARSSPNITRDG